MLGSSGGGVCDAPLPWLTLDTLFTAINSPIAPFRTYCETNLASRLMPSAYWSEDRKSPKSLLAITDFITRIQGTGNTREFWEASNFSLEFGSSPWRKSHHFWIYFKWTVTSSQTLHFAQVCSNFVAFCVETAIDMTIWCLLWIRTTKNTGDFCPSIHPSPVRPMCDYVSIYYSVHVAIRTQIPHKQWTLLKF